MSKRKSGLGNLGIDVLLSAASTQQPDSSVGAGELKQLAIEAIHPGKYQPRARIDPETLEELAASITAQGVVQPVAVRPVDGGTYELIAGERRWRAAQLAGLEAIPAVIKSIPDQAAAAMGLIENIQRENLNPLEEAAAFERLIQEFALTHREVAGAVGRSRTAVTNLLRLLELAPEVRELLQRGELEMGHARALLALAGGVQAQAARHVAARGLSVRETERYVKRLLEGKSRPQHAPRPRDPDVARLEQSLGQKLGARVDVRYDRHGKGSLVIHYNSLDELDGILDHIN